MIFTIYILISLLKYSRLFKNASKPLVQKKDINVLVVLALVDILLDPVLHYIFPSYRELSLGFSIFVDKPPIDIPPDPDKVERGSSSRRLNFVLIVVVAIIYYYSF